MIENHRRILVTIRQETRDMRCYDLIDIRLESQKIVCHDRES